MGGKKSEPPPEVLQRLPLSPNPLSQSGVLPSPPATRNPTPPPQTAPPSTCGLRIFLRPGSRGFAIASSISESGLKASAPRVARLARKPARSARISARAGARDAGPPRKARRTAPKFGENSPCQKCASLAEIAPFKILATVLRADSRGRPHGARVKMSSTTVCPRGQTGTANDKDKQSRARQSALRRFAAPQFSTTQTNKNRQTGKK